MIRVTNLHQKKFAVNSELIEMIENTPDTMITLTTGKKIMVLESIDELIEKIIEFRTHAYPIKIRRRTEYTEE